MVEKLKEAKDVYELEELKIGAYNYMIDKYKTQIKSFYYYEQFIASLIKHQKKDFRIELFKRLLIPDGD